MREILDDKMPGEILDNLGALVTTLKEMNEDMKIFICELVPASEADEYQNKIKDYNNKLIEWSFNNNVAIIKTDLPFKLGTGSLDDMCFNKDDVMNVGILNRYGAVRLLDTIRNQYPEPNICDKIKEIKES